MMLSKDCDNCLDHKAAACDFSTTLLLNKFSGNIYISMISNQLLQPGLSIAAFSVGASHASPLKGFPTVRQLHNRLRQPLLLLEAIFITSLHASVPASGSKVGMQLLKTHAQL